MSDGFDLETWLASVQGETVYVTSVPDQQLGGHRTRGSPCVYSPTYCSACDDLVVRVDPEMTHTNAYCPLCGREPGLLELGTHRIPEDKQPYRDLLAQEGSA